MTHFLSISVTNDFGKLLQRDKPQLSEFRMRVHLSFMELEENLNLVPGSLDFFFMHWNKEQVTWS